MNSYIEVPLTQGYTAIVDVADYETVIQHKWHAIKKHSGLVYAATNLPVPVEKKQRMLLLHRLLMPEAQTVDHINGSGVDNRRANLRAATHAQNMRNRKIHKNNKSGFKGVYAVGNRWRAEIKFQGVKYTLGYHDTPEAAAAAYDDAARRLHGEFARTNEL